MSTDEGAALRKNLRELLRVGRFENWSVDALEDEITTLFRGGVNVQPADPATQPLGPP